MLHKRLRLFIVIFIAVVLTAGCCIAGRCASAGDSDDISVEVSIGYSSGAIPCMKWFPVYVKISNNTDRDISGSIHIKLTRWNTYYYFSSSSDDCAGVEKEFSLAGNTEKTIEIPVYEYTSWCTEYTCTVTSSNGKKLFETSGTSSSSYKSYNLYYGYGSQAPILVGYMTENASDANVFGSLDSIMTSGNVQFLSEHLTPDRFPSSETMIDDFDVIFIGNIDTTASSSFTAGQLALLEHYIANGGTVVVGTGKNGSSVLRLFRDYFSSDIGEVCTERRVTSASAVCNYYYLNIDSKNNGTTDYFRITNETVCDINDADFSAVSSSGADICLYKHNSAGLYVASFEISDAVTDSSSMVYFLMAGVLNSDSALASLAGGTGSSSISSNVLTKDTRSHYPSGIAIALLMSVYIASALLIAFIVMRKRRKENYMWGIIPAAAVLFSAVFIVYGAVCSGPNRSSSIKFVNIGDPGSGIVSVQSATYLSAGGKYTLSYGCDDGLYYPEGKLSYVNIYESDVNDATAVYGRESGRLLKATKDAMAISAASYTDTSYGELETEVYVDSSLKIKITNNTGRNLSSVCAYYVGARFIIGDIAAGDTVEKEFSFTEYASDSDLFYELCYRPAGLSRSEMENDHLSTGEYINGAYRYYNDNKLFKQLKNNDLLYRRAWLVNQLTNLGIIFSDNESVLIFGFDDSDESGLLINGKSAKRDFCQTVIYKSAEIAGGADVPSELFEKDTVLVNCEGTVGFYEDGDGKFVFGTDGAAYGYDNYYCMLVLIPERASGSFSCLSFRAVFEDPGYSDYFQIAVLNAFEDAFETVKHTADGDVCIDLLSGKTLIHSAEVKSYKLYNGFACEFYNDWFEFEASFTSNFTGHTLTVCNDAYPTYSKAFINGSPAELGTDGFGGMDVVVLLVHCDSDGLRKKYGENTYIAAPSIENIGFGKEHAE